MPLSYMRNTPVLDQASQQVPRYRKAMEQGLGDTFSDAFAPAARSLVRYLGDELDPRNWELPSQPKSDIGEEHREELTEGLPIHLHSEVMGAPNLEAAQRRALRYRDEEARNQRLAAQTGLTSAGVAMLGSLVDLDLPLAFASGGMYGATRIYRGARAAGLGRRGTGALLGSSAVGTAMAGTEAVRAMTSDHADWTNVADAALMGIVLGGALGFVAPGLTGVGEVAAKNRRELMQALSDPAHPIQREYRGTAMDESGGKLAPEVEIQPAPNADGTQDAPFTMTKEQLDRMSINAAAHPAANPTFAPLATGSPWLDAAKKWVHDTGFDQQVADETASLWGRIHTGKLSDQDPWVAQVASRFMNISTGDYAALFGSKSALGQWMAGTIFESASGAGRMGSTATMLNEMFHAQLNKQWVNQTAEAQLEWARAQGRTIAGGHGVRFADQAEFNRLVRKEMNARALGKPQTLDPAIAKAANALDEAHEQAAQLMRKKGVYGAEHLQPRKGFLSYRWSGAKMRSYKEAEVVGALENGYINAGTFTSRDVAREVAQAVYRRFTLRDAEIDAPDSRLLSLDTREGVQRLLEQTGVPASTIKRIMDKMTVDVAERRKKGFLSSRNEIDLDTPLASGGTLNDLMQDDLIGGTMRYMRGVAGSSALAAKGIRSEADLNQVIKEFNEDRIALGEDPISPEKLRAMFSHFNAGPSFGYTKAGGLEQGVNPWLGAMMQATRVSLLQQLGISQMMDTANAIVANGVERFGTAARATLSKTGRAEQEAMLKELEDINVIVGNDHLLFKPHLNIEELSLRDDALLKKYAQPFIQTADKYTAYLNGFNLIQSKQQTIAAAATTVRIIDDIMAVSGRGQAWTPMPGKEYTPQRLLKDAGLEPQYLDELEQLINSGVINRKGGALELNADQWSAELREEFGAAIMRNVRQQVQMGLAGERSVWMNTTLGRLFTQLRTFGMVAMQKNLVRNVRVLETDAVGAAAWGTGTAFIMLQLKDMVNGTERDLSQTARLAVTYSPMLGIAGMTIDPVSTMLGFDDFNVSPFGQYASPVSVPLIETLDKLAKFPGAVQKKVTGNDDWESNRDFRAMFFMNLYGMQRVFD